MTYMFGISRGKKWKDGLMAEKEAKARIKINKLLEESGWRFFDSKNGNGKR
jgi:hypothetical protein